MTFRWPIARVLQERRRVFSTTSTVSRRELGRRPRTRLGLKPPPLTVDRLSELVKPLGESNERVPLSQSDEKDSRLRINVKPPEAKAKAAGNWEARVLAGAANAGYRLRKGQTAPHWEVSYEQEMDPAPRHIEKPTHEPVRPLMLNHEKFKYGELPEQEQDLLRMAELEGYDASEASSIYIGRIPVTATPDDLVTWFAEHGAIEKIRFRS